MNPIIVKHNVGVSTREIELVTRELLSRCLTLALAVAAFVATLQLCWVKTLLCRLSLSMCRPAKSGSKNSPSSDGPTRVSRFCHTAGYEVDPDEQSTFTIEHAHDSAIGDLFMFVDVTKFHDINVGNEVTWYGEISCLPVLL